LVFHQSGIGLWFWPLGPEWGRKFQVDGGYRYVDSRAFRLNGEVKPGVFPPSLFAIGLIRPGFVLFWTFLAIVIGLIIHD
jgi:hypothetical protein